MITPDYTIDYVVILSPHSGVPSSDLQRKNRYRIVLKFHQFQSRRRSLSRTATLRMSAILALKVGIILIVFAGYLCSSMPVYSLSISVGI